jgi:hypothetical protein
MKLGKQSKNNVRRKRWHYHVLKQLKFNLIQLIDFYLLNMLII